MENVHGEAMNEKITRTFAGQTKTVNESKKTADVLMSDETLDRAKEVILIDAWKARLPAFLKHPVLLDSHKMTSNTDILGRWEKVEARSGEGLIGRAHYLVEEEKKETPNKETVRWAWVLVRNNLAAYSVQFIVHKGIRGEELLHFAGLIDEKIIALEPYRVFTDVELLETSQVVVPCNPSALLKSIEIYEGAGDVVELGIAKGVFDKGLLQMPKKTFLIQPPKSVKETMRIKCEVDESLLRMLFAEAGEKNPSAEAISHCLSFSVVEPSPEEEVVTVVPAEEVKSEEPAESEGKQEPGDEDSESHELFGISEEQVANLEKCLSVFSFPADELDQKLGQLNKVLSWAEEGAGDEAEKNDALEDKEKYFLDKLVEIFGNQC